MMQEFITSVAQEYDWPVMKSYKALEISKTLQNALVGQYTSADQSIKLSIEQKKDMLFVKSSGAKKGYQLYKIGDNHYTFENAQDYYKLSFNLEGDIATLIYAESIGKAVELKKTE